MEQWPKLWQRWDSDKLHDKHDNESTTKALYIIKAVIKITLAMYVQNHIRTQIIYKITEDNLFLLQYLLSYLYRKSSRWESQQSLNKCFIHSPDLFQNIRIPEIIWRHHVLNCKENKESGTLNQFPEKNSPVAKIFFSSLTDNLPTQAIIWNKPKNQFTIF